MLDTFSHVLRTCPLIFVNLRCCRSSARGTEGPSYRSTLCWPPRPESEPLVLAGSLRGTTEVKIVFVSAADLSGSSPVGGAQTSILLLAKLLSELNHRVTVVFRHDARTISPFPSVRMRARMRSIGVRQRPRNRSSLALRIFARVDLHRRIHQAVIRGSVASADVVYTDYRLDAMEWVDAARKRLMSPPLWIIRIAGVAPALVAAVKRDKLERYEAVFGRATALNFLHPAAQELFEVMAAEAGLRIPDGRPMLWDIGTAALGAREVPDPDPTPDSIRPRPFRLVMVSRFSTYQKRQELLIEAFARVRSDATLTFIGEGSERESMERLVAERGLGDRITFLDQIPQADLWERLRGFDLQCLATDYEGVPKIILESMAVGLPVLASRVTPLDELIADEVDGFLVDNDPDAWAAAIDRLATERGVLKSVVTAAKEKVREQFDALRQAERFVALVEEMRRDVDLRRAGLRG